MTLPLRNLLNALGYLFVFLLVQFVALYVVGVAWFMYAGDGFSAALARVAEGQLATLARAVALSSALASLITIVVFAAKRWSPFSRSYLRSRPWAALCWVVLLALGTIIPSEWLLERLGVEMSEPLQHVFEGLMAEPLGYVALGILAPVAEEMVFRGAILRALLRAFDRSWHWVPIVLSALLFGAIHLNMAQFVHASLLGLLLGWMYYRTNSIVPGIVLHWVNNTVAYVVCRLLPQAADASLADFFGGSEQTALMAVGFSLLIFLPALYQVALRLRRP